MRAAAFDWLSEQVARHGDVLPRPVLAEGFELDGRRVPLLGPQGIFKPAEGHLEARYEEFLEAAKRVS